MTSVQKIVFTGVPGSGKSWFLNQLLEIQKAAKKQIFLVVPEVPTVFVDSGLSAKGWESLTQSRADDISFMQVIQETRIAFERYWVEVASQANIPFLLMDRGTVDNGSYLESHEDYERIFGRSLEMDLTRYDYVLHLGGDLDKQQKKFSDPDIEATIKLESRLRSLWSKHPGYYFFPFDGSYESRNVDVFRVLANIDPILKRLSSKSAQLSQASPEIVKKSDAPVTRTLNNWLVPEKAFETIHEDQMVVMLVGGPSYETAFHDNPSPEVLVQLKGSVTIEFIQSRKIRQLVLYEGDMCILPPNVPHRPIRAKDTQGLVIERMRSKNEVEHKSWYCRACVEIIKKFTIDEVVPRNPIDICTGCTSKLTSLYAVLNPKVSSRQYRQPPQRFKPLIPKGPSQSQKRHYAPYPTKNR